MYIIHELFDVNSNDEGILDYSEVRRDSLVSSILRPSTIKYVRENVRVCVCVLRSLCEIIL